MNRHPLPAIGAGVVAFIATATFAQTVPVQPQLLVETTDISAVSMSLDDRSVAFRVERASVAENRYLSEWHVVDLAGGGTPIRIADGGIPLQTGDSRTILEFPQWSPDSSWLYFRALFDGEIQVWRASRHVSAERVTSDAANVRRFQLTDDGESVVYEVGATREQIEAAELEEFRGGVLIDGHIHGSQNLYRSFPIEGRAASHRIVNNGERALLWDIPPLFRVQAINTGEVTDAPAALISTIDMDSWGPTDWLRRRTITARSVDGSRTATLSGPHNDVELRAESGSDPGEPIICEPCRSLAIENVGWRGNEEIVFTARNVSRGYANSLFAWNPDANTLREIISSDGLLGADQGYGGSTCAIGTRYAACVTATANIPPRLERVDLDTGDRLVIFDPNRALADAIDGSTRMEALTWSDENGNTFTGHLFTPAAQPPGQRVPLLINYYACPGFLRGGGIGDEWPMITMAGHGIAGLCINRAPFNLEDAYADYETGLSGVRAIVRILSDRGIVNAERVGMGGLSFGSEVTTWVSTHSDLLEAASVSSAFASPSWYWFRSLLDGWTDVALRRWGLGAPDDTPEEWRQLSPVFYVDRFQNPILMQMIEGEYRSSIEQYVRMRRAGVPVELWVFPEETHVKRRPASKLAVYERNLDWFRFWLQDYIDADPAKEGQFNRWLTLRGLRDASRH